MILPIKFKATQAGHYPCQILLKCQDDIRVVRVECTVNPEGSTAEIEFSAPVHHSVVQNLPIVSNLVSGLSLGEIKTKNAYPYSHIHYFYLYL